MTQIIAGKGEYDGAIELRVDTVARDKPASDGTRGPVDIRKSKAKAKGMINKGEGVRLTPTKEKEPRPTRDERMDQAFFRQLKLSGLEDQGNSIKMNLLSKSGLVDNRVVRDLNILETSVKEAAHHLREDQLQPALDRHFMLDNLDEKAQEAIKDGKAADGCVTAALLLMNAAMLHQRIANGHWLSGVSDLSETKNDVNVVRTVRQEWEKIMRRDFHPVLEPAVDVIDAAEKTGKLAGLERALHHLTAEAERIAETYADMGADHAGPLFNRVMGNQASDGAFFTRPVAASIAARLTLDVCGDVDWTNPSVWREHKTVDLACGSGTLLAAMLSDMKRRAREQGTNETTIADLQRLAVEDTIKGLDINPISLQLAASQLTAGNHEIRYRNIGLELMPYGPKQDDPTRVSVGTLELMGQNAIVPRHDQMDLGDDKIASQTIWNQYGDADLENAVDAVKDARIIIMNPPFDRSKMGEKFPKSIRRELRARVDDMEQILVRNDGAMAGFVDANSLAPLFTALADKCLVGIGGVLTTINPTVALSTISGQQERCILAKRFHIHTILTCHQPRQISLSQKTNINESVVVARRHDGPKPPTRFINLDRLPLDESEVADFHLCLSLCHKGSIANGWGEVSHWPAERMAGGDWTPAVWRSPELAESAEKFAKDSSLTAIKDIPRVSIHSTYQTLYSKFRRSKEEVSGSFPILASKGATGQSSIASTPDEYWIPKQYEEETCRLNGGIHPETEMMLEKAGHLQITQGQDNRTGRLTATASDDRYVGIGYLPVTGLTTEESKATAVFINSTPGRLQLMRNPGRKLEFPLYNPAASGNIRIPNVNDTHIRQSLSDCWERTKDMVVPQFRDGECEVRRLWDEAVAEAMDWDSNELAHLRLLLHQEPHVRGLGYGQFADAEDIKPADREHFQELADQWEEETFFLSRSDLAAAHPLHQEIITLGTPVVPLILERMRSQGGHWFEALEQITGEDPVSPADYGNIAAMQNSWLQWGDDHGYA